jgi:prepilin peptidase CpaA
MPEGLAPLLTEVIFIGLMASAAICDARSFRIPNAIPLGVTLLFATAFCWGSYHPLAPHLISFAVTATVGSTLFYFGIWGGGDAKLLAAVGLFVAPDDLAMLALTIALSGGVVAVIAVVKRATRAQPQKSGLIPYGIAISAGGLYWCFTGGG